jgi:hypothetical protein
MQPCALASLPFIRSVFEFAPSPRGKHARSAVVADDSLEAGSGRWPHALGVKGDAYVDDISSL